MTNLNVLSLYAVITTGIGAPFSRFFVFSLNYLQKSIILRPLWPKAGPTGGDGFAPPAGICNLINSKTSFATILSFLYL